MNLNLLKAFNENFAVKFFVVFNIFIFIISLSFAAFFLHHQSQFLTETLIKNGKLLAKILAHNAKIGVFSENEGLLIEPVNGILQQEKVLEVSVFNQDGNLLINRPGLVGTKAPSLKNICGNIKKEQKIFKRLEDYRSSLYRSTNKALIFWSPVFSSKGYSEANSLYFKEDPPLKKDLVIGFVKITVDKATLNQQLKILLLKSIFIGIILVIIGSAVTYFMVKGITRPLNRLTEGARTLERGEVMEKIPVETRDEIGKLATAFNSMYESLKKRDAEKEQLEEQLRHSQKMEAIGTLAGGVAHDFNNILTRVIGYSELILYNMKLEDPLREKIEAILEDGLRAESLTRQLLAFSRKEVIQPINININEITENLNKMLVRLIGENINFETNLHPDVYPVLADPKQIEQIIINLVVNARDAMTDTGTLTIETANITINESDIAGFSDITAGNYVVLSVQDTGCGISKENLAKIFEPFFTTKEVGKGTGLGLSTVYGIVKQNHGDIKITSEPDKGTTINIYLPRLEERETTFLEEEEEEEEIKYPEGTETILLVEDDGGIRQLVSGLLRDLGYTVHETKNGMEALQVFEEKEKTIDLLLTDVIMPKMGGIKLAEEITSRSSAIKVLFISGYIDREFDQSNLEDERIAILQKPFNSSTLSRKIRDILDEVERN